jgi:pilus assembly protein CpaF
VTRDGLALVRRELRDQIRQRVDARGLAAAPGTERRMRVREEALDLLRQQGAILPQRELARMVNEISDEVVGFGPIEFLLKDPSVTEVMVNGADDVFVEREGRIKTVRVLDEGGLSRPGAGSPHDTAQLWVTPSGGA